MKSGLLVILAAPSGTGKSTICKRLIKNNKNWNFSISATTRKPREGEIDDKDYKFISNTEFEHFVKFGDFLEWEIVHGNKYGTLWSSVEAALDNNKVMIFDIDVKVKPNVKKLLLSYRKCGQTGPAPPSAWKPAK